MSYKAVVTKITTFGVADHEEHSFDTWPEAADWIKRREPFGYSKPTINGEPVNFSDLELLAEEKSSIADIGEERREQFRANAIANFKRVPMPRTLHQLDAIDDGEDAA
jgi:hypothetical protein